jgi:O-antigen ligase
MTAVARVGWAAAALFFATLLASLTHVDYVGLFPELLLFALALLAAIRPVIALHLLAAAVPVAWWLFQRRWNPGVPWAETLVCAALAGLCSNAAIARSEALPLRLRAPVLLFGAIVIAAVVAALGVPALRLGPGFRDALATQLVREYFVDSRGFPALHAGMLLLEGVLLFALSARAVAHRGWDVLAGIAAMTVVGATTAAAMNIARLFTAASRGQDFWSALVQLSQTVRLNVHYADYNAAGSYFAMAALAAIALTVAVRATVARIVWGAGALTIMVALWLTASRAAYLAFIVSFGAAIGTMWLVRSGRRVAAAAAMAAATAGIVLAIAMAAPMRGNQHSSFVAADVRLGMAGVAVRMIRSYPFFGIGPGEFQQRSGEFATPELIAKFPVAVHENAHNNFLQIAAELGLTGGVAFVWLVIAALLFAARGATREGPRLLVAAALMAFVITWLGGHPLLVPEPAYAFWILAGAAAGGARRAHAVPDASFTGRLALAVCVLAIVATIPPRTKRLMNHADLEHIGIGVSRWEMSTDGIRYREGKGHATLFVPAGAFKFSVNPRTDAPVRLEVTLDGRVADIVTLAPQAWNDLLLPPRSDRGSARFASMELRVLDGDDIRLWITKVEPIQ